MRFLSAADRLLRPFALRLHKHVPLRLRFMVAPMLAMLLIVALSAAFYNQIQRQNALLEHILEDSLVIYHDYAELFSTLADQHLSLVRLLQNAQDLGEGQLYDRSRQHLEAIFTSVDRLERWQDRHSPAGDTQLQDELVRRTRAYREAMTRAVEMTTVDLSLAPRHLADVNTRFSAMNRIFLEFLDRTQQLIQRDAEQSIAQGGWNSRFFAASGILSAFLLLGLSVPLARYLSRDLERQSEALARLSVRAGADQAVFDQALTDLRDHEQALRTTATMLKEDEEQLRQLAFFDPLTSLPNRALFRDRLDIAIANAKRQQSLLGVMYVELDRFKYVNDTLGHGWAIACWSRSPGVSVPAPARAIRWPVWAATSSSFC